MIHVGFDIFDEEAPAFRSLVLEMTAEVGDRLRAVHASIGDRSLTRGASALGKLRAAVCTAVPTSDRYWPERQWHDRRNGATAEREESSDPVA